MYGFIFQMAFDYAYLPPSGRTALHGAAQKGWNEMVRLLVENGAEVQPVDASGRTPRNMAMGNYELAITEARPDPLRKQWRCSRSFVGRTATAIRTRVATSTADRSRFRPSNHS